MHEAAIAEQSTVLSLCATPLRLFLRTEANKHSLWYKPPFKVSVLLLPPSLLPPGALTSSPLCIVASQSMVTSMTEECLTELACRHHLVYVEWTQSIWTVVIWQHYLIVWNCCGSSSFWIVYISCNWGLLVTCASRSLILWLVFLRAPG
jgi:hypothetical protein